MTQNIVISDDDAFWQGFVIKRGNSFYALIPKRVIEQCGMNSGDTVMVVARKRRGV